MRILTPTSEDSVHLADWVEITMVLTGQSRVSRHKLRNSVRDLLVEDGDRLEQIVDFIFQEVGRRSRLAPVAYPFTQDGQNVALDKSRSYLPYVFLLCLAISEPLRSERRQQEVEIMFDHLALDALRRYMGPGSRGVRFGWPCSGGRPTNFIEAITWLCDHLNLSAGRGHPRPRSKDGGVDVVVWRPFADGRPGFLTILAQCTVELSWEKKARDVVEGVWMGWVDFGKPPLSSLAIPFVVPVTYDKWDDVRRTMTILLDRMRLVELIGADRLSEQEQLERWTVAELTRMRAQGN